MKRESQEEPPKPYVHWDSLSAYLSYSTNDEVPEIFGMHQTQYKGPPDRTKNKQKKSNSRSGANVKKYD